MNGLYRVFVGCGPNNGLAPRLWAAFGTFWIADLLTTVRFFFVPNVAELNPVTVFLYGLMGVSGVILAATCYAGVVVGIVRGLPTPFDEVVLVAATLMYGAFALHNLSLLVWNVSLFGLYVLGVSVAFLTTAFSILLNEADPSPSDRRNH